MEMFKHLFRLMREYIRGGSELENGTGRGGRSATKRRRVQRGVLFL